MFWTKKMYDFYLAGPMRGYPGLNKSMFTKVSRMLRDRGFTVWSPSEHDSYLKLSFGQCMTTDLNAVINQCRSIALLPGWRDSLGANMESFVAFACGKKAVEVILSDDETTYRLPPVNLSLYCLPYQPGGSTVFDPHKCDLDSFSENS